MRSAGHAVVGGSTLRTPGRSLGGHASAIITRGVAGGGLLGARLELRGGGGIHYISPAGEISTSSPQGWDVLADDAGISPDEPDVPAWPVGPPGFLFLRFAQFFFFFLVCMPL